MLLPSVIPLSFEHFPFIPFPLYSLFMCPFCHCSGGFRFCRMVFMTSRYISLVVSDASIMASLGIPSGPVALFRFSDLMALFSSSWVIFGGGGSWLSCSFISLTLVSILLVHSSYSGFPGLAWYRFS